MDNFGGERSCAARAHMCAMRSMWHEKEDIGRSENTQIHTGNKSVEQVVRKPSPNQKRRRLHHRVTINELFTCSCFNKDMVCVFVGCVIPGFDWYRTCNATLM